MFSGTGSLSSSRKRCLPSTNDHTTARPRKIARLHKILVHEEQCGCDLEYLRPSLFDGPRAPVLLSEEELAEECNAGFREITRAICALCGVSLLVNADFAARILHFLATYESGEENRRSTPLKTSSTLQTLKDVPTLCVTGSEIAVSVKSDGGELKPYAVNTTTNKRTVFAHIMSTAGKLFEVKIENKSNETVAVHTYVDGSVIRQIFVHPHKYFVVNRARISDRSLAPMRFADCAFAAAEGMAVARCTKHLGTIVVKAYRATLRTDDEMRRAHAKFALGENEYAMQGFPSVAQTGSRSGGHRVSLDCSAAESAPLQLSAFCPVDSKMEAPFVTFKLKYHPEACLIADGIISL